MNTPNCCEKCLKIEYSGGHGGKIGSIALPLCSNATCSCHTAKTSATPDWEKEFRETNFYRIMNGNAPITDMIEYIRQSRLQYQKELVERVRRYLKGIESVPWDEEVDEFVESLLKD